AQVDGRCDRIAKAEEHITRRVEDIERASAGVLTGKDFRLKERDRLKDKVAALREDAASDADPDHILADVHAAVRYTLQYGDSDYAEAIETEVIWIMMQGFDFI